MDDEEEKKGRHETGIPSFRGRQDRAGFSVVIWSVGVFLPPMLEDGLSLVLELDHVPMVALVPYICEVQLGELLDPITDFCVADHVRRDIVSVLPDLFQRVP